MNKIVISGRLTSDPELRALPNGDAVCAFTLAVNRRGKDDKADFFRVNAFRKLGELCAQYLIKGQKCTVAGSVRINEYTNNNGQARTSVDVTADDVEFGERPLGAPQPAQQTQQTSQDGYVPIEDDGDLPF